VSLPETPLLGVLPGTGGLTRVVDKRRVRRDLADMFGTLAEGVKGKRAVEWKLVDAVHPASKFKEAVAQRAAELAKKSDRPAAGPGIELTAIVPAESPDTLEYSSVKLSIDRAGRVATLVVRAPEKPVEATPEAILAAGASFWPLRVFREIDDAVLRLRLNEPEIGVVVVKTEGDRRSCFRPMKCSSSNARTGSCASHPLHQAHAQAHRSVRAQLLRGHRAGQRFAGTLFELALAADRIYMLDDPDGRTRFSCPA
jgi:benzoyl-CoA-dihydrodiol lyase